MSYLVVGPELTAAAAANLDGIGAAIRAANNAAAFATTQLLPAAQDEVSAAIAALFGSHAHDYQGIAAQATAFHDRFAQVLGAAASSYASAESANVLQIVQQDVLGIVNAPTQLVLGRPLIGDGANG
ncbi:PE family protein, partial [Mycobacterium gordonae]|uniref:PE family protein n=2 Tax=Mycobacteriaceae TaxID=1762 RepID=UPI000AB8AD00